ncbi:MAG TPA: EAL domain-containing protein [Candidatus Dormibacteraeota bacterium]
MRARFLEGDSPRRATLLRVVALIYIAAAAGFSVWVAAPSAFSSDPLLVFATVMLPVTLLIATGMYGHISPRIFLILQLASVPWLTILIFVSGKPDSIAAILFLWGPPYAFAVSGRRYGILQMAMVAVCYGAVTLVLIERNPDLRADAGHYASVYLVVVTTVLISGVLTDRLSVSARRATEQFRRGFDRAVVGTAIVASDGTIREANEALCELLRRPADRIVGRRLTAFVVDEDSELIEGQLRDHDEVQSTPRLELRFRRASGEIALVEADVVAIEESGHERFFYCQFRDVTAARRAHEVLTWQANTDALTQLPNRTLLNERISEALRRRVRHGTAVAVVLLDLDRFKLINDSFGHGTGDELLIAVAKRLRSACEEGDTVARLGGDEFVVVRDGHIDVDAAVALAQKLLLAVRETTRLHDLEVSVTTSIGIAFATARLPREAGYRSTVDPEDLIRHADVAMYQAKSRGGNTLAVFDDSVRDRAMQRLRTEIALRQAVRTAQLEVHYQPVCELEAGTWTGLEALVRWRHPERGLLSPTEFIALAEETDLIVDVGRFVIRQAIMDLAGLRATVPASRSLSLAVNVSARQLAEAGFTAELQALCDEFELPPHRLAIEITETLLMGSPDTPGQNDIAIAELEALRPLGVTVVVDDFGTGFSSLSYLRRLPVDAVKIDRSFVSGIGEDLQDPAIVTAIVDLARALGLEVIAEGIESETQRWALARVGCTHGQGYIFGRAMPVGQLADRIAAPVEAAPRRTAPVRLPSAVARRQPRGRYVGRG